MAADRPVEVAPQATIPFDYLAVAEELHSGRIRVSDETAQAEYVATGKGLEAELKALLGADQPLEPDQAASTPEHPIGELSIEPAAIAIELGLDDAKPGDLSKLRRAFALMNHPDRVPPQLRKRALERMQVANRLIDEAKRSALASSKR